MEDSNYQILLTRKGYRSLVRALTRAIKTSTDVDEESLVNAMDKGVGEVEKVLGKEMLIIPIHQ